MAVAEGSMGLTAAVKRIRNTEMRCSMIAAPVWIAQLGLLAALSGCSEKAGRWDHYSSGGNFVGDRPSVSPDGSTVIYSTPKSGHGDLYVIKLGGSRPAKLTSDPSYEGEARHSKDGRKVVFVGEHEGVGHIWLMDVDGSNPKQLTDGPEDDGDPSLSPDGSKIVFTRRVGDWKFRPGTAAACEIFVMNADGSGPKRLTDNERTDGWASFSPDGRSILYHQYDNGSNYIAIMDTDGANSRRIGTGSSPEFSPDGRKIAFISGQYGREISIMSADGSGRRAIYRSEVYNAYPTFTPDGSRVLFVEMPEGQRAGSLMTLDLTTSAVERIAETDR